MRFIPGADSSHGSSNLPDSGWTFPPAEIPASSISFRRSFEPRWVQCSCIGQPEHRIRLPFVTAIAERARAASPSMSANVEQHVLFFSSSPTICSRAKDRCVHQQCSARQSEPLRAKCCMPDARSLSVPALLRTTCPKQAVRK